MTDGKRIVEEVANCLEDDVWVCVCARERYRESVCGCVGVEGGDPDYK